MATGESEKRVVRVTIFQQPYTLRVSTDPAATEAVARGVDELMHQISERTASVDASRVAVMAALHLADRLRAAEAQAESGVGEAETKLRELQAQLNEAKARAAEAEELAEGALRRLAELEQSPAPAGADPGALMDFSASLRERLAALDERLANLLEEERL